MERLLWETGITLGLLLLVYWLLRHSHWRGSSVASSSRTTDTTFPPGSRDSSRESGLTSALSSSSCTEEEATATAIHSHLHQRGHKECPWFDPKTHCCLADESERAVIADALALGGWPDVPPLNHAG